MKKYVDFDKDIKEPYESILKGAYNKANIWPKSDRLADACEILAEEFNEVDAAYKDLVTLISLTPRNQVFADKSVHTLHGHVLSIISELLQVLAVCNKYCPESHGGVDND